MALFSIVIPLYNKEKYIERCLRSVLSQHMTDYEAIVIDDGSTDRSYEIAASIRDPRVSIVRQENQGEGAARNAGLKRAQAAWVAFLDADDAWVPQHLDTILQIIMACPEAALVSTQVLETWSSSASVPESHHGAIRYIDYFKESTYGVVVTSSSAAVSRKAIGGRMFGSQLRGCDTAFWVNCALQHRVAISTAKTAIYYRGTGGVIDRYQSEDVLYSMSRVDSIDQIDPGVHAVMIGARSALPVEVRRYADHRINGYIRGALVRRKPQLASDVAHLYSRCRAPYAMLPPMLCTAPKAINLLVGAYQATKQLGRYLRGDRRGSDY